MVEFIGYLAGVVAMISFLPQVIKSYRTKSSKDLSLPMLFMTLITNILYLIYGFALKLTPIIVMISIMSIIILIQIRLTLLYRNK